MKHRCRFAAPLQSDVKIPDIAAAHPRKQLVGGKGGSWTKWCVCRVEGHAAVGCAITSQTPVVCSLTRARPASGADRGPRRDGSVGAPGQRRGSDRPAQFFEALLPARMHRRVLSEIRLWNLQHAAISHPVPLSSYACAPDPWLQEPLQKLAFSSASRRHGNPSCFRSLGPWAGSPPSRTAAVRADRPRPRRPPRSRARPRCRP
jgi:hypothetical protein